MHKARVWLFGDDVDTDQIIASQYLILPSVEEMKAHAFETLSPGFAGAVEAGDVVVAGRNFGCGSSREQAPAVLKAVGVKAVVAQSFARIFYRNAINIGLPVLISEDAAKHLKNHDTIQLDTAAGVIQHQDAHWQTTKLPQHMQDIVAAGGLLNHLNSEEVPPCR